MISPRHGFHTRFFAGVCLPGRSPASSSMARRKSRADATRQSTGRTLLAIIGMAGDAVAHWRHGRFAHWRHGRFANCRPSRSPKAAAAGCYAPDLNQLLPAKHANHRLRPAMTTPPRHRSRAPRRRPAHTGWLFSDAPGNRLIRARSQHPFDFPLGAGRAGTACRACRAAGHPAGPRLWRPVALAA